MKNVSYVNVAEKEEKEAANESSQNKESMDVTALMNMIEKKDKNKDKPKTKKINKDDFLIKESANDIKDDPQDLEITAKPKPSITKYIVTFLIAGISITAFIGMLYTIDNKAKNWVKTHKSEQVITTPVKTNENELLDIISKQ